MTAASDLIRLAAAINSLPDVDGREPSDLPEYRALVDAIGTSMGVLQHVGAEGLPGLQAKARALHTKWVAADADDFTAVAESLASDLLGASQSWIEPWFDAAYAEWREAELANREPSERCEAALASIRRRHGQPTIEDIKAAWALPGVTEASVRTEATFGEVAELASSILRLQAVTAQGFAVQARALIPHIWPAGNFEDDAALGDDEDMGPGAVRDFIQSCCNMAGFDRQGHVIRPQAPQNEDAGAGLLPAQPLIDGLSIATQSLADLLSLRDIAGTIKLVAYGMAALPCSTPERGHQTVAGRFALWLAELAGEVQDHAQNAACARSPAGEDEAGCRLQAIAASVAANGDPMETRALAKDFEALARMVEIRSAARG